jgi:hypothetical protein
MGGKSLTADDVTDPEAALDEVPEVTAAREWLEEDETNDLKRLLRARDVLATIRACLKDVMKLKTTCSIKAFTRLTAVAEYFKL